MASPTIVAPAPADALDRARLARDRQALLDGYASFRGIIDGYEEPARPSADDVDSVLSLLRAVVAVPVNQLDFQTASTDGDYTYTYSPVKPAPGAKKWSTVNRLKKLSPLHLAGTGFVEGRSWFLRLSPGTMGLRCQDLNRKEQAAQRQQERDRKAVDIEAAFPCSGCPLFKLKPVSKASTGEIMEWSARSRSRMSEQVGSLDYSEWSQEDGALAMVTLTLPGDWQAVAPDGKTFKKLLRRFELRWRRNVGAWRCLWKLEFQRRGAPHWHALMRVPALVGRHTFEEWLSLTWADVVGASKDFDRCDVRTKEEYSEYQRHLAAGTGVDFSGKDFSDPRRISLYFLGHSSKTTDGKEYQHRVPERWQAPGKGPGRFWGNPGLSSATREIEITQDDAIEFGRQLRKVKRARAWTTAVQRARGKAPQGQGKDVSAFAVEVRRNEGRKRGRAAHRTYNRRRAEAAAARGELFAPQPRFVPSSLGAGGYAVGGWVLVNDALQLAVDTVRRLENGAAAAQPAHLLGRGSMAERWAVVQACRVARGAAPSPLVPLPDGIAA